MDQHIGTPLEVRNDPAEGTFHVSRRVFTDQAILRHGAREDFRALLALLRARHRIAGAGLVPHPHGGRPRLHLQPRCHGQGRRVLQSLHASRRPRLPRAIRQGHDLPVLLSWLGVQHRRFAARHSAGRRLSRRLQERQPRARACAAARAISRLLVHLPRRQRDVAVGLSGRRQGIYRQHRRPVRDSRWRSCRAGRISRSMPTGSSGTRTGWTRSMSTACIRPISIMPAMPPRSARSARKRKACRSRNSTSRPAPRP